MEKPRSNQASIEGQKIKIQQQISLLLTNYEVGYVNLTDIEKSTFRKQLVPLAQARLAQEITNPETSQQTELPTYSGFAVFAIMIYRNQFGQMQYSEGTNYEQVSCCTYCAERVAIGAAKTSLIKPLGKIVEIVLVSNSATGFVTPGMVCREAISEEADENLVITCGGIDGSYQEFSFTEFNPYPNLFIGKRGYRAEGQDLSDLELEAHNFAETNLNINFSDLATRLNISDQILEQSYYKALEIVRSSQFANNHMFPLRKTAVAIFANGECKYVDQLIAVEYTSSDPISSLVQSYLTEYARNGIEAKVIFQVDKYGIIHLPFSWSRSLLCEQGLNNLAFKNVPLLGFVSSGQLKILTATDLVPHSPEFS